MTSSLWLIFVGVSDVCAGLTFLVLSSNGLESIRENNHYQKMFGAAVLTVGLMTIKSASNDQRKSNFSNYFKLTQFII